MNKQEEKLFNEIQYLVEELPWTNKLNLEYFRSCVHEAGHGVGSLITYEKFNNPMGFTKMILVANVTCIDGDYGHMEVKRSSKLKHNFLLPIIPDLFCQTVSLSGPIYTEEFYKHFYGFDRVSGVREKVKAHGGRIDFNNATDHGYLGCIALLPILRASYSMSSIRILHLRLIRDLLINNGELIIENLEDYIKEKEL